MRGLGTICVRLYFTGKFHFSFYTLYRDFIVSSAAYQRLDRFYIPKGYVRWISISNFCIYLVSFCLTVKFTCYMDYVPGRGLVLRYVDMILVEKIVKGLLYVSMVLRYHAVSDYYLTVCFVPVMILRKFRLNS